MISNDSVQQPNGGLSRAHERRRVHPGDLSLLETPLIREDNGVFIFRAVFVVEPDLSIEEVTFPLSSLEEIVGGLARGVETMRATS